jgi:hypothetical protein
MTIGESTIGMKKVSRNRSRALSPRAFRPCAISSEHGTMTNTAISV